MGRRRNLAHDPGWPRLAQPRIQDKCRSYYRWRIGGGDSRELGEFSIRDAAFAQDQLAAAGCLAASAQGQGRAEQDDAHS